MSKAFNTVNKLTADSFVLDGKYKGWSPAYTWGQVAEEDPEYIFGLVINTAWPLDKSVLTIAIKNCILAKKLQPKKDEYPMNNTRYNEFIGDGWDDIPF